MLKAELWQSTCLMRGGFLMERNSFFKFIAKLVISALMLALAYKVGDQLSSSIKNKIDQRSSYDE